jgi:hypothetical protein
MIPFYNDVQLDPPHEKRVSNEEQYRLRDGDRGEGRQVRQPGGEVQHRPDAGGDDEREEKAGHLGPDRTPDPARHEPAERTA